ncbi:MAG: ABC transporter permease subunit [Candidatus Limnocylindrales bacterium]
MKAHLRADLIRLRGRWDVWVLGIGIPVFAAVGYFQGYANVPTHYFSSDPTQPLPDVIVASIAAERATYAFPHSLLLLIGSAPWLLAAMFAYTALLVGIEYDSGTIRTALIASPDRRSYLASRLLVLAVLGSAILAGLIALGAILPGVMAVTGNSPPPSPIVAPIEVVGAAGSVVVSLLFVLSFAALLAVATRNPALPVLVGLLYFVIETFLGNLNQWRELNLDLVRGSLPFASVMGLLADASDPAHYGSGPQITDPNYVDRPLILSLLVVAGWAVILAVAADELFRRSDIRE